MNGVISEIEKQQLQFVLCFYDGVIMHHSYNGYGNKLNTGTLLTDDAFRAIFNFVKDMPAFYEKSLGFKDLITKNVLKFSTKTKYAVWVSESQERKLMYQGTKIKNGKYKVPPMLWILKNNALYVYALKSSNNITMDTKVYYAPFYNVNSTGLVCMGSAYFNGDHTDYSKIISDVQDKFFNSYFTISQNRELTVDFIEYCRKVVNKNEFDLKLLIDTKLTIKKIIDGK